MPGRSKLGDIRETVLATRLVSMNWGVAAAIIGIAAFLAGTDPAAASSLDWTLTAICLGVSLFFVVQLAVNVTRAARRPPHSPWKSVVWLASLTGLIDVLAALPVPLTLAAGASHPSARLFGVFWSLKLIRASPAFALLGRVVRNERQSLLSVTVGVVVVLLFAATGAYLTERTDQPDAFASVPAALWWAVTTLTTTGYGDKIPASFIGRLLGSGVMVCGIGLFALWAGILSSGFSQEIRRSEFLKAWDVVVQFPLFQDLGASAISEVTRVLKVQDFARGALVVREGAPGDSMYFVAEGAVEVRLPTGAIRLGPGKFFGEMALVANRPRSADVMAIDQVRLLRLDIVDFRDLAGRNPELLEVIEAESRRREEKAAGEA